MKLDHNEKLDIDFYTKRYKKYRPRRRGWHGEKELRRIDK